MNPPTVAMLRAIAAMLVLCVGPLVGVAHGQGLSGVGALSLEELSNVTVTSVSGRPQTLRSAPASIYVLTGEEIRRSAASNLREALRLAPNLHVAQQSAGEWAISARGSNNTISNKLLVLIDGRPVYSPLFAGVFWDQHDLMLEDVERIEVISGPGGTIWGANAVNGVINVVTRPAWATVGPLASITRGSGSGGGSGVQAARIGLRAGGDGYLRLYAMAQQRAATRLPNGLGRDDDLHKVQAGFRGDWNFGANRVTFQGDWYEGGSVPSTALAPRIQGGNLNAHLDGQLPDGSPYRVQMSHDVTWREDTTSYRYVARTSDLQFLSEQQRRGVHQWTWGAGMRISRDDFESAGVLSFGPRARTLSWANVFAQDQLRVGTRGELTLGLKLERNSYTGLHGMPSVRYAYAHGGGATTWAAISRAIRAPARLDRDLFVPARAPFVIAGGRDFQSEVANVYEVGHRGSLGRDVTYDVTLFRQQYRGLRVASDTTPVSVVNRVDGHTDGIEAWARWNLHRDWRVSAGYLHQRERYAYPGVAAAVAAAGIAAQGNDPRHQFKLASHWDIGSRGAADLMLRRIGALPSPAVPAHTAVDARFAWALQPTLELSLLVQNAFDRGHVEFGTPATASEIGRRVLVRLVWQP